LAECGGNDSQRAGGNYTWIQVGFKNKTLNWNEMMHTVRQYVCRSDYQSVVGRVSRKPPLCFSNNDTSMKAM